MKITRKIVLVVCPKWTGALKDIVPELLNRYGDQLYVPPLTCPANLKPLSFIAILKHGWDGLIVICPKESCSCPHKVKSVMRKENLRNILPVFGISPERMDILTSPFDTEKVCKSIAKMLEYIELEEKETVLRRDPFMFANDYKPTFLN